ncbi:MAG: S-layer homology domain-containing protein [Firmicutes bacterium]|nr:S-layer homology domain-containing protein [Bacillota bacterium]
MKRKIASRMVGAVCALTLAASFPVSADMTIKQDNTPTQDENTTKKQKTVSQVHTTSTTTTTEATTEATTEEYEQVKTERKIRNENKTKSSFYSDVNENSYPWAIAYVDDITERGIAKGVGGNLYAPGNLIERGDFFLFIERTFKLPQANTEIFDISDVKPEDYYFEAVVKAKVSGIIDFTGPVYPEMNITRGDAMLYIYRALAYQNKIGNNTSMDISKFGDASTVTDSQLQLAIGTLANIGIVKGDGQGLLNINSTLTRAEMASVFSNVCEYIDDFDEDARREAAAEKARQAKERDEELEEEGDTNVYGSGDVVTSPITAENEQITLNGTNIKLYSGTAVSLSKGATLKSRSAKIETENAQAIEILNSEATLDNNNLYTTGASAINMFGEDSVLNINGGKYLLKASAEGLALIKMTDGTVNISDGAYMEGGSAPVILTENGSKIAIASDSELTSTSSKGLIVISDDNVKTDNKVDRDEVNNENVDSEVKITVTDANLKNTKSGGSIFFLHNGNAKINITDSTLDASNIINAPWEKKERQDVGSNITLNTENTELKGDIVIDDLTTLKLYFGDKAKFSGSINGEKTSDKVDITIDDEAIIEFTGQCRFRKFVTENEDTAFNNIDAHGNIIYYDASDDANDYLDGEVHNLPGGGELRPW